MSKKIRVGLVFGGRSGEHPVSIVTAAGVLGAIDRDKYDVIPVGITRDGQWVAGERFLEAASMTGDQLPEVVADSAAQIVLTAPINGDGAATLTSITPGGAAELLGAVDVIFPVLHGPYGEDGTVQGLFELAQIPYVGTGVLASAVGMDKEFMKLAFAARGLAVGPHEVVRPREWSEQREQVLNRVGELKLPLYVKPARGGSSLGVTRVEELTQLDAAIAAAQAHDPKVIIEEGIVGREIECAVLGGRQGQQARASVPGEIVVHETEGADFYDFEAKYVSASQAKAEAPADLPADVTALVRQTAIAAFEALDGEGLSRVDVFVTPHGEVVINEINTMPGFTPISMYPKMWEASGVSYPELIDELLTLALERPVGLR